MEIKTVDREEVKLIGYYVNTKNGFFKIPRMWHKLNKNKDKIKNRTDINYLVGVNDYSKRSPQDKPWVFDSYAMVEVSSFDDIPADMTKLELSANKYAVFSLKARSKDPLESTFENIYKKSLPDSGHIRDEKAAYDMTFYCEAVDENGESDIEIWIPIVE